MQTEVKKTNMTVSIPELAKEFELKPGHVYAALGDLGLEHDGTSFDADADTLELIRGAMTEQIGSKEIVLKPNPTPRDVATALDVPQPDVQKALMMKMKVM